MSSQAHSKDHRRSGAHLDQGIDKPSRLDYSFVSPIRVPVRKTLYLDIRIYNRLRYFVRHNNVE